MFIFFVHTSIITFGCIMHKGSGVRPVNLQRWAAYQIKLFKLFKMLKVWWNFNQTCTKPEFKPSIFGAPERSGTWVRYMEPKRLILFSLAKCCNKRGRASITQCTYSRYEMHEQIQDWSTHLPSYQMTYWWCNRSHTGDHLFIGERDAEESL